MAQERKRNMRSLGLGSGSGSSGTSSLEFIEEAGQGQMRGEHQHGKQNTIPKLDKLESFALADDSSDSDNAFDSISSEKSFDHAFPRKGTARAAGDAGSSQSHSVSGRSTPQRKHSTVDDGGVDVTPPNSSSLFQQLSAKQIIGVDGFDSGGVGGNMKELFIHRLTHQTLRKVLQGADAVSSQDGFAVERNHLIHNTVAVMHVADRMIKESRLGTGGAVDVTVSALSAQAREYLGQYNTGSSAESIQKSIHLAKSAYEAMMVHDTLIDSFRMSLDGEASNVGGVNGLITNSGLNAFFRSTNSRSSERELLGRDSGASCKSGVGGGGGGGTGFGGFFGVSLKMFSAIDNWDDFDAIVFEEELKAENKSARRGILTTTVDIVLRRFDILEDLHLSHADFSKFTATLEAEYGNPDYHTATHAADVVQAVGFMLAEGLFDQITTLQALVLVVAAAAHDVGHPGFNNAFLIFTESNESLRWNEVSVNENGHLHIALRLLRKHKVLDSLDAEDKRSFKAMLRRLILGTDMEKHTQMVTHFVAMATESITAAADDAESGDDDDDVGAAVAASSSADTAVGIPVRDWEDPVLALCYVLHCADISNPARPFPVAKKWGEKISEEFYKQGDMERELGMRVLAFCDRALAGPGAIAQNQGNFIDFVCKPTFEALTTVLPNAAKSMLRHLKINREEYRKVSG